MIEVKVDFNLDRVLDLVRGLRKDGYTQGTHFDFRFVPRQDDNFSYTNIVDKHTVFTFYDEELAMMFALKYSS